MTKERPQILGFLEKHRIAKDANAKEMRLTMQEADSLSAAIGVLLARSLELAEQVIALQESVGVTDLQQDGGSFK